MISRVQRSATGLVAAATRAVASRLERRHLHRTEGLLACARRDTSCPCRPVEREEGGAEGDEQGEPRTGPEVHELAQNVLAAQPKVEDVVEGVRL